ncbi:MAG TPA: DUF302 domain-containing protein [Verrucomicrobiae bacterium]|jgi:uncharacterized protein (DUF302 family)
MNAKNALEQNRVEVEGLTSISSDFGPDETMARLEKALIAHGMKVFCRINHAELASEAGMKLRPTEVILFGNPRGGTSLMQASQTLGIDLPLKALVWQDALGKTWLSYNEPSWLAKRHNAGGLEEKVSAMRADLSATAAQATKQ